MTIQRTDQTRARVLVVDADPLMLTATSAVLDQEGYQVVMARTPELALRAIASEAFDCFVVSIDELQSGCQFTAQLRSDRLNRDVPVIFLVPQLLSEWSQQLSEHGGVYSLLKPFDPLNLAELVEKTLWLPHLAVGRLAKASGNPPDGQMDSDWVTL